MHIKLTEYIQNYKKLWLEHYDYAAKCNKKPGQSGYEEQQETLQMKKRLVDEERTNAILFLETQFSLPSALAIKIWALASATKGTILDESFTDDDNVLLEPLKEQLGIRTIKKTITVYML